MRIIIPCYVAGVALAFVATLMAFIISVDPQANAEVHRYAWIFMLLSVLAYVCIWFR